MSEPKYHAPVDCPVCGGDMIITRKGCLNCGSELAGEFADCAYCALSSQELDLLNVFLTSRGNMREVEKFLGVSYPTARARFDELLAKLNLAATTEGSAEQPAEEPGANSSTQSPREQILARVANGELAPDVAAALIAKL